MTSAGPSAFLSFAGTKEETGGLFVCGGCLFRERRERERGRGPAPFAGCGAVTSCAACRDRHRAGFLVRSARVRGAAPLALACRLRRRRVPGVRVKMRWSGPVTYVPRMSSTLHVSLHFFPLLGSGKNYISLGFFF
jgi:hypothetical protein